VVRVAGLSELRSLRDAHAVDLQVELVEFPGDEWEERDGRIVHRRTNFFQVVGHRDAVGIEHILLRQPESALVGLLTAVVEGARFVLLNVRAEPGLHGGCQFSATIQSTPSNYERRHGGGPTQLIDLFLHPPSAVRLLHSSWQYDWAQYYDAKVKRFLVIEADELLPVDPPLVWVAEADFVTLLSEDFMATGDLRVAAMMLRRRARPSVAPEEPDVGADEQSGEVPLRSLLNWRVTPGGIDEIVRQVGSAIRYAHVRTSSREVSEWSQPLMTVDDMTVALPVRATPEGLIAAVERRTATGLRGARIWFPAALDHGSTELEAFRMPIRASGEGGRFLRHDIRLEIVIAAPESVGPEAEWVAVERLLDLAMTTAATSLELRLALSTIIDPSESPW